MEGKKHILKDIDNQDDIIYIDEEDNIIEKIENINQESNIQYDEIPEIENNQNEINFSYNDEPLPIDNFIDEEFNSEQSNRLKKKTSIKFGVVTCAILDVIAIACLFLMYGPISYFRNLWVTSAIATMSHQYLAYVFFNNDQIQKIMENNVVIEIEEDTEVDSIFLSNEDPGVYDSIYEEQVLKRDPENDIYKVIDIEGTGYKGHLLVVYDPSRIDLVQAPNIKYGGKQLETLVEINDGLAGINASGFNYVEDKGYIPTDIVIMDNKLVWGEENKISSWGGIIGFTNDNVLVLSKGTAKEALDMGMRDAVSFGPFLIVNGEPAQFKGNGGYGIAPRTAIGQRKDGTVLLLVIDGRRPGHSLGVDMVELTNILLKYGAYNASNLDGGGSSSMVVDGEVISVAGGMGYTGERYLPNGWIVK